MRTVFTGNTDRFPVLKQFDTVHMEKVKLFRLLPTVLIRIDGVESCAVTLKGFHASPENLQCCGLERKSIMAMMAFDFKQDTNVVNRYQSQHVLIE